MITTSTTTTSSTAISSTTSTSTTTASSSSSSTSQTSSSFSTLTSSTTDSLETTSYATASTTAVVPTTTRSSYSSCPFNSNHTSKERSKLCIRNYHECCHPLPDWLSVVNGVITAIFSIVGILGNAFSTVAIASSFFTPGSSMYSHFPNMLLINLNIFDILFCGIIMPHHAVGYFYNGMPFSQSHCKYIGFLQKWIIYGERITLAIIAVNATNVLRPIRGGSYCRLSQEIKLLLPWILTLPFIIPPLFLPGIVRFEYNPDIGECTISSKEVDILLELLGTYLPFFAMILSYTRIHHFVCSRQRYLSDEDPYAR